MGTKSPKGSNFFRHDVCNTAVLINAALILMFSTPWVRAKTAEHRQERKLKASACAQVHAAASVMSHLSWVNSVNELEKGQKTRSEDGGHAGCCSGLWFGVACFFLEFTGFCCYSAMCPSHPPARSRVHPHTDTRTTERLKNQTRKNTSVTFVSLC